MLQNVRLKGLLAGNSFQLIYFGAERTDYSLLCGLDVSDFLFSNLNAPSMIASAAICASFQGLRLQMGSSCPSKYQLVQMISEITGVDEVRTSFVSCFPFILSEISEIQVIVGQ